MNMKRIHHSELPKIPRRRMTGWDITMLIGVPAISYVAGVTAGLGNIAGLVLAGFASLGVMTFHTMRLGRRNEPRIPPYTRYVAVAVAVVVFVTAWGLYRQAPQPDALVYLIPTGPLVLFAVLVLLMFRSPQ